MFVDDVERGAGVDFEEDDERTSSRRRFEGEWLNVDVAREDIMKVRV